MHRALALLKRAVARLVAAEIAHEFKGCGNPEDYEAIEAELVAARENYQKKCTGVDHLLKTAGYRR